MKAAAINGADVGKRRDADFYPTPAAATRSLLNYLNLSRETSVWEPACGDGAISEVCKEYGFRVVSSDLYDRGYGIPGVNFVEKVPVPFSGWIITNPPFALAEEFIRQSLRFDGASIALLFKATFWHARKRASLFRGLRPTHILPMTFRPDFTRKERGGSPTMDALWTVWDKRFEEGQTFYDLLDFPLTKRDT